MKIKYQFKVKSLNKEALFLYQEFLKNIFDKVNITAQVCYLPVKKKRITLLKSPHVNKTAREQFEIKSYKFILDISSETVVNVNVLKQILLNKPKIISVSLKKL